MMVPGSFVEQRRILDMGTSPLRVEDYRLRLRKVMKEREVHNEKGMLGRVKELTCKIEDLCRCIIKDGLYYSGMRPSGENIVSLETLMAFK